MNCPDRRIVFRGLIAAALLGLATAAGAHGEGRTQPPDGATLAEPPETIRVRFEAPTRVTTFTISGPDGSVALADAPSSEASERIEVTPAEPLQPGTYEVTWRALGADGHAFSGGIEFTVTE